MECSRQSPRFSIIMIFWIFCSDTETRQGPRFSILEVRVVRMVQVVQVVNVVSLDDMPSENIWFTWSTSLLRNIEISRV